MKTVSISPGQARIAAFDRYAYTTNNPVKYTDPSGHRIDNDCGGGRCSGAHGLPRNRGTRGTSSSAELSPTTCSNHAPYGNPFHDDKAISWGFIPTSTTISRPPGNPPEPTPPSLDPPNYDLAFRNHSTAVYIGEIASLLSDAYYFFGPFSTADIYAYLYYLEYANGTTTFPGVTIVNNTDTDFYINSVEYTYWDTGATIPFSNPGNYWEPSTDPLSVTSNSGSTDHLVLPENYIAGPQVSTITVTLVFRNWDRAATPIQLTLVFPIP